MEGSATGQSPADLQRARREREERERADRGKAPLPGEAPDEQPEDEDEGVDVQLSIEGDADLKLSPGGGRKPDTATIVLQGGEIELGKGAFELGQRLAIVVEGTVDVETTRYHRDRKTGQITGVKRKHALIIDRTAKVALGTGAGDVEGRSAA